jgi:eukaryotic-like serine/threonine-protein kinase
MSWDSRNGSTHSAPGHAIDDTLPAAPREPREPAGRRFGKYVLLRELGEGGMGVVHEAHDPDLERLVAVKLLHPKVHSDATEELGMRLLREARAMAKLSHPHVTAVYEASAVGDQLYIAMELVRGTTLKGWLEAEPRTWREVLAMFLQAGDGLVAAHREALVHRDFKPSNVLVGEDHRARVADFGVARLDGALASGPGDGNPSLTGDNVLGTPAYMAPEQHRGEPATARSDQFAFCCSLWQAIYREHPFAGATHAELHASVTAGARRDPPPRHGVPKFIEAALMRGLAFDPAARFDDMAQLLDELRRDPARTRRRWAIAGLGVGLAATALWGALRSTDATPLCDDAGADIQAAWNPVVAARLSGAFVATGLPFALATHSRIAAGLGGYAETWSSTRVSICRATHEQGVQSAELLDLRMACLDRKRRQFELLVDQLAHPDDKLVIKSVGVVGSLDPLDECTGDAAALRATTSEPADPVKRAAVAGLRGVADRASAAARAGRVQDAVTLLRPAASEAAALDVPAIRCELELALADGEQRLGAVAPAEQRVRVAMTTCARAQDHRRVARAWRELIYIVGYERSRLAEASTLVLGAESAHQQAGADPFDSARLLAVRGSIAQRAGDFAAALDAGEQALAILERVAGPQHYETIRTLSNIGTALIDLGRKSDAEARFRRAIAAAEVTLGPEHPDIAMIRINLGMTLRDLERRDEARAEYARALPILERAGLDASVGSLLINVGVLERGAGNLDAARTAYERALVIRLRLLGPDHPGIAEIEGNLGNLDFQLKRIDDAERHYRRTLEIRSATLGPDHIDVARALWSIAKIDEARGRFAEAIAGYERSLAVADRTTGQPDWTAASRSKLALVMYEHAPKRRRDAIAVAERARAAHVALGDQRASRAMDELLEALRGKR